MNNRHGISDPDAKVTTYSNPSIDLPDKVAHKTDSVRSRIVPQS
jgi:hypothetical protein